MKVTAFIEEIDGPSAAPGGGSVSALVGTLACALARMYGHLSIGKKKFAALDRDVQERFHAAFEQLKALEVSLLRWMDEDTDVYRRFMQAMKLPKGTEQEAAIRMKAIQLATQDAIESPLAILELSGEGIGLLIDMIGFGNSNALSDIGVAVSCFEACAKGAYLNVIINLAGLQDQELAYVYERKARIVLDQVLKASSGWFLKVRAAILPENQ